TVKPREDVKLQRLPFSPPCAARNAAITEVFLDGKRRQSRCASPTFAARFSEPPAPHAALPEGGSFGRKAKPALVFLKRFSRPVLDARKGSHAVRYRG